MKKIKFECSIKRTKIYVVLSKDYKSLYVHYKKCNFYGYREIHEDGSLDDKFENISTGYDGFLKDFLDYDLDEINIYEFENMTEAKQFIKKQALVWKLRK